MKTNQPSPWMWIPTLYFAEGIPYFIVNNISVTMFTKMGVPNGAMALFTSLLYLPWAIKPLWSPFVDILKTKRWWILSMQILMSVTFILTTLSIPHPDAATIASQTTPISLFTFTLILFIVTAFASATHDIAADGFYMLALDQQQQSFFVGIRSTFYRLSSIFGQGVLVYIAGYIERTSHNIPLSWTLTMAITSVIFTLVSLYHTFVLPKPKADGIRHIEERQQQQAQAIWKEFARTFVTFIRKPGVLLAIVFMLLYRLPEAFLLKMVNPFLLDSQPKGGLALATDEVGVSMFHPTNVVIISTCVAIEQFGYGFGFTAYMLYMMYFSEGEFTTAHYAICTAFMALSMMIPGMFAGYLQEWLGYEGFFWMVMVCCVATVAVTIVVRKEINANYGRKTVEKV